MRNSREERKLVHIYCVKLKYFFFIFHLWTNQFLWSKDDVLIFLSPFLLLLRYSLKILSFSQFLFFFVHLPSLFLQGDHCRHPFQLKSCEQERHCEWAWLHLSLIEMAIKPKVRGTGRWWWAVGAEYPSAAYITSHVWQYHLLSLSVRDGSGWPLLSLLSPSLFLLLSLSPSLSSSLLRLSSHLVDWRLS